MGFSRDLIGFQWDICNPLVNGYITMKHHHVHWKKKTAINGHVP